MRRSTSDICTREHGNLCSFVALDCIGDNNSILIKCQCYWLSILICFNKALCSAYQWVFIRIDIQVFLSLSLQFDLFAMCRTVSQTVCGKQDDWLCNFSPGFERLHCSARQHDHQDSRRKWVLLHLTICWASSRGSGSRTMSDSSSLHRSGFSVHVALFIRTSRHTVYVHL